ncbi:MAG: hypothetical protein ACFCUL_03705 [Flavobacteriaceae bacterium]
MVFRLAALFIVVVLVYYIYQSFAKFKNCEKCNGKGYWLASRGDRYQCDHCKGSGKFSK